MHEIIVIGACLRMLSREPGVQKYIALWRTGLAGCFMIDGKGSFNLGFGCGIYLFG